MRFVEDMNCVAAGSLDCRISLTDAEERVPLKMLEGHTKGVTSLDWSPIHKFLCRCGNPFSDALSSTASIGLVTHP